ncbi:MAG: hypothetical protein V9G12_22420 [Microthrixaceae bacterium]|jgi:hypothetical protein
MVDAGATDHTAGEPSWSLTIALAAVIVVALLAGIVVLIDGSPSTLAGAGAGTDRGPASPSSTPSSSSSASTSTSAPSTATSTATSSLPSTAPLAPTTTAPLAPPTTEAPGTVVGGFAVSFPTPPRVASVPVATESGTVTRTEYNLDGPDGSLISVTSVELALDARPVASVLTDVAAQAGRGLGASPIVGTATTVGGQPALPFSVSTSDGVVRAVVVHGADRLTTVSMFTPGHGPAVAADRVFDELVASVRLV